MIDPAELAKRVNNGATVRLGEALVIWKDGAIVVLSCSRCKLEQRMPSSRTHAMLNLEGFAEFLHRHQHVSVPS